MPRVSIAVAVPTRNRVGYLRQSLDSILGQTLTPSLLVLSDDGSADETPALIEDYRCRFESRGVKVIALRHDPPLGQEGNRRAAFRAAEAEMVAMLDDDDVWDPNFLRDTSAALAASPHAAFVAVGCSVIRGDGSEDADATRHLNLVCGRTTLPVGFHDDWAPLFCDAATWILGQCLFRRLDLEAIGFIPEGADLVSDYALFLTLGISGCACVWLRTPLYRYRVHENQASVHNLDVMKQRVRILERFITRTHKPTLHGAMRTAGRKVHTSLCMELAHAGRRHEAAAEAVHLLRVWGPGPEGGRLVFLPLLLLGLRRARRRPPAPHAPRMLMHQ